MKLIINTNTEQVYFVHLPNYADRDQEHIDKLLSKAKELIYTEEITTHYLNSDELTDDERKQLDIHGEIKYPMKQLMVF